MTAAPHPRYNICLPVTEKFAHRNLGQNYLFPAHSAVREPKCLWQTDLPLGVPARFPNAPVGQQRITLHNAALFRIAQHHHRLGSRDSCPEVRFEGGAYIAPLEAVKKLKKWLD